MKHTMYVFLGLLMVLLLTGCFQGRPSRKPPIHWNPSMDKQQKYKTQEASLFFEDGSNMRLPVEGTVSRENLRADIEYYTGKNIKGEFIKKSPVKTDLNLINRGQERFNIYCAPCHGKIGEGQGIVVKRGMLPPTSFFDPKIIAYPDGQIFDVISNGVRNMPSYRHQISVEDRWAIISYFRALQRSRTATMEDIPEDVLKDMR